MRVRQRARPIGAPESPAKLPRRMAVLWALLVGLVIWIVLWAIGVSAFDAFLVPLALVMIAVTWRLIKPFLERQLGRS